MTVRTPDHPDIVSVLRKQVDLSRRDYKLRLSLKLSALERVLSGRRDDFSRPWRFGDLLDLLQTAFDSRQRRRLEALRAFSNPNAAPSLYSVERVLFGRVCQIQTVVLSAWRLSLDVDSLDRTFTIASQWSAERGSFDLEFAGLHDFLTSKMTFPDFTSRNRQWVLVDANEKARMRKRKAVADWQNEARAEPWKRMVQENTKFIERVTERVRNCFAAKTPVRSLLALADAIAMCETMFRLVSAPQDGDTLHKFLVMIVEKVSPSEIVSWVAWIGKCFTGMYDQVLKEKRRGVISGCLHRVAPHFGKAINVMYGFVADLVAEEAAKAKGKGFEYVMSE
jgi:hypothetical protein